KVAFKTGTSYGRRDAWSIGYSAHFTIGVWVGNADNRGSSELVGSKAAAPLLIDLFNAVSAPYLKSILPMPSDVGIREVCARSGKLPTPRCTQRIMDYYSYTKTLNITCDLEREFQVAVNGRFHYCASCLGSRPHKTAVYADQPAELLSFWDKTGFQYKKIPPHNSECTRVFAGEGPRILSPTNGMTYYQVSPRQQLTLFATSTVDVREHRWYYDRMFLGGNKAGDKVFLPMSAGEHVITCTDEKGRASTISILIKDAS
ncbi:MAG TPA: penicillin-binding protein 1C, partial [Bacteroidota bacterium]